MKYNIEIERATGTKEVYKKEPGIPFPLLLRALEKGEIKSIYIELA